MSRRILIGGGALVLVAVALAWIGWSGAINAPVALPTPAPAALPSPQYVGGAACASCHAAEHAAWRGSDHDLAMQPADEASVLGDFNDATFTYAGTTSTFSRSDGKFIVRTDGADGVLHDYIISYTFGVRPLQQYLVDFDDGRKQALSIAWDARAKEVGGQRWFHLYPNDNVKAGDWLHWTNYSQNWNFTCAECHSTDLKKRYDAATDTYDTTWAEIDVSCEACHGPGSNHVGWARREGDWRALDADKGFQVALNERVGVSWNVVPETGNAQRSTPRTTTREIDTCARCHGRAGRLTDEYVHGASPHDSHRLSRLDADLYHDDGQMRDEVYNWGSFVQSKMHAQGVTCSDCHDPHSLQLRAPGNAVCAQCHLPTRYDAPSHTNHVAGSAGAACAACHMPTTTYMVVDPRHDHSLRVPRPDLSVALGTPNACNSCHARESAQWAADAVAAWGGAPQPGYQQFARAFNAGAKGAPGATDALLAIINDPSQPALVRASAIDRLDGISSPGVLAAIARALADPDPLVVLAAVEKLAGADDETRHRYITAKLVAPVRSVRAAAARALAGSPERLLNEIDRAAFKKALDEYIAIQTYLADRPEGHTNLGNLYALRGDAAAAIAAYQRAIAIDPLFTAAFANLADIYRAGGDEANAEATLRRGIEHDPQAAALHYALGLALTRQKRSPESLTAFATAMELAPADARFAYVYAVALNSGGERERALKSMHDTWRQSPYDRDVLSALVFFSMQAADIDAAQTYAKQLLELEPHNAEYQKMAKQLGVGE